jgi:hypothetical protein
MSSPKEWTQKYSLCHKGYLYKFVPDETTEETRAYQEWHCEKSKEGCQAILRYNNDEKSILYGTHNHPFNEDWNFDHWVIHDRELWKLEPIDEHLHLEDTELPNAPTGTPPKSPDVMLDHTPEVRLDSPEIVVDDEEPEVIESQKREEVLSPTINELMYQENNHFIRRS